MPVMTSNQTRFLIKYGLAKAAQAGVPGAKEKLAQVRAFKDDKMIPADRARYVMHSALDDLLNEGFFCDKEFPKAAEIRSIVQAEVNKQRDAATAAKLTEIYMEALIKSYDLSMNHRGAKEFATKLGPPALFKAAQALYIRFLSNDYKA